MRAVSPSPAGPGYPSLILASQSPRRRELLSGLGWAFSIDAVDVEEEQPTRFESRQAILDWVAGMAAAKAAAVAGKYPPEGWVIGADTIVVLGCEVLHKPADEADAVAMLSRLQGRSHTVMTGVALRQGGHGRRLERVVQTEVTFYPATEAELAAYVAAGESLDKAGAYAAQGRGALIIEKIEGCYFNVVGLPLATLARMLREVGHEFGPPGSENLA
ncbi:MAG: septum formation protein Maf [Armatimonadetes bacterium]|nr:septum formation protein Maf [Armatimonadota bacterium]